MEKSDLALGILFRMPELGKVKKRLAEQIGDELALKAYQVMLNETLKNVQKLDGIQIYGFYEGALNASKNLPSSFSYLPQEGMDLGDRMANAVNFLIKQGHKKIVLIGSDSPDLPVDYIQKAFYMLDSYEVVIGPSNDGGYYLIGLNKPFNQVFKGIVWGSTDVLNKTITKIEENHLSYIMLPQWYDIDDLDNLLLWISNNKQIAMSLTDHTPHLKCK